MEGGGIVLETGRFYSNRATFHWMMKQIFTTMVEMFVYIRNSLDPWKSKSTVHKNLDFSPLVDDFRGAGNLNHPKLRGGSML